MTIIALFVSLCIFGVAAIYVKLKVLADQERV